MKCSLALLAAVLAAARLACVRGHGHLALPRARQVASYRPNVYIPHGNSVGWGGIRPISNPGAYKRLLIRSSLPCTGTIQCCRLFLGPCSL